MGRGIARNCMRARTSHSHYIKKGTIERAEGSERLPLRLRGLFAEIVQFLPELWRKIGNEGYADPPLHNFKTPCAPWILEKSPKACGVGS